MSKKNVINALETVEHSRIYEDVTKLQSTRKKIPTASPAEQEERKASLKTQGKKGCKAVRINMAFTPDNHEFVKVMSRIRGESMTEFTNYCIARYRAEHPELYERALEIIEES